MPSIDELIKKSNAAIKQDEDLILLSIFSSVLAAFGIYLNNDYVVIASMLVAPFFDPILAMVIYIVEGRMKGIYKSLHSLAVIFIASFSTGVFLFKIFNWFGDINNITFSMGDEFLSYFIIAVVCGSVGMFLWLWPKVASASSGVAIAVSLVPPLIYASSGLILADQSIFKNSMIILSINFIGILFGAIVTFYAKLKLSEKDSQ